MTETTIRKRIRYNHCGGSGMMRSIAMMPTKATKGAMYEAVARRWNSVDWGIGAGYDCVTAVCYGNPDFTSFAAGRWADIDHGYQAVADVGCGRASVAGGQLAVQGGDELLDL